MSSEHKLAIFRDSGFGTRLSQAAHKYLADYVYSDNPNDETLLLRLRCDKHAGAWICLRS